MTTKPFDANKTYDADEFRRAGHAVVDQLADYLKEVRSRGAGPVLPAGTPEQMLARFAESPRDMPHLVQRIIASTTHFHHPRNLGHQVAPPLPEAALCDLVSALLNNSSAVYETSPAGSALEQHAIDRVCEVFGYEPRVASGLVVLGGSLGNLTALLAARKHAQAGERAAVLVSEQAHYCVGRAAQIMGLEEGAVYRVPVDERFRMRVDALQATYERALADGRKPFVVVGSAATTATGSIDPLGSIADFAKLNGLWFHIDGAHGAALKFSRDLRHRVAGLERADSIVWDAHKLALMPALCTTVLFKDGDAPYLTFSQQAHYLYQNSKSLRERWFDGGPRTIECTRPMAALKLYALLELRGPDWLGSYVQHMCELTGRFAERIHAQASLELATSPDCNIVCFRPRSLNNEATDALRTKVNQEGEFYLVRTVLNDRVYLRTTLLNPLTTDADLDELIRRVLLS